MTIPAQVTGSTERRDPVRLTPMELDQLRTAARTLSMAGMADATIMNLRGRDPRLQGAIVSAAFFESLRARPLLGRVLAAADEAAGASPVILLSYDTWRRHFGEDPQIVGRAVTIDPVLGPRVSTDYTVIGVMPEDFQFPSRETRAWTTPRVDATFGAPRVATLAQLADGVSLAAAESEILPLIRQIRARYRDNADANYELVGVQQELVRPVTPALIVLTVAVGLVLLLACVNVANLLLARTAARQREIAIRGALGAGRGRLIRYFLTESMTLALCGGLVGVVLAFGGVRLLRSLTTTLTRVDLGDQLSIPRIDEIGVDWVVLGVLVRHIDRDRHPVRPRAGAPLRSPRRCGCAARGRAIDRWGIPVGPIRQSTQCPRRRRNRTRNDASGGWRSPDSQFRRVVAHRHGLRPVGRGDLPGCAPIRPLSACEDEGLRRRTGRETAVRSRRRERGIRQSTPDGQSRELIPARPAPEASPGTRSSTRAANGRRRGHPSREP